MGKTTNLNWSAGFLPSTVCDNKRISSRITWVWSNYRDLRTNNQNFGSFFEGGTLVSLKTRWRWNIIPFGQIYVYIYIYTHIFNIVYLPTLTIKNPTIHVGICTCFFPCVTWKWVPGFLEELPSAGFIRVWFGGGFCGLGRWSWIDITMYISFYYIQYIHISGSSSLGAEKWCLGWPKNTIP